MLSDVVYGFDCVQEHDTHFKVTEKRYQINITFTLNCVHYRSFVVNYFLQRTPESFSYEPLCSVIVYDTKSKRVGKLI